MKVEIRIQISSNAINSLGKFFEPNLESIYETQTLYFNVKNPGEWLTEERKIAFQKKLDEADNGNLIYKVESIAVVN